MTDTPIHAFLSHGLESGPGSTKIQAMKAEAETFPNIKAHAIDHRSTKDPSTRLKQMQAAMAQSGANPANTILAGSSMGGWVCAQTSSDTPVRAALSGASPCHGQVPPVQPDHPGPPLPDHPRLGGRRGTGRAGARPGTGPGPSHTGCARWPQAGKQSRSGCQRVPRIPPNLPFRCESAVIS